MKNKIFIEQIIIAFCIILIWTITHIFTIGWGLPNPMSFAIDSIPPQTNMSAFDMMHHENMQYPPLQYLIVSFFIPKTEEPKRLCEELVSKRSDKMFRMRLITATMSLISALAISFFMCCFLNSTIGGILAGFCFICTPISLYYSHTSNMDQAYLMWWILSIIAVFVADRYFEKGEETKFLIWSLISGALFALSFCTKDQVYALYTIPLSVYLIWLYYRKRSFKFPIKALLCWILSFATITSLVYWLIGGWDVFYTHIRWISNSEHQILYAQCENDFWGRINFIFKTLTDLAKCLDIAILGFLVLAIPHVLYKYSQDTYRKKNVLRISVFLVLIFASLQLLFVQVVRFSFPRYYLPILPIACCLVSSFFVLIRSKFRIFAYTLFVILIAYQTALACQFLFSMKNDSRLQMKNMIILISNVNSLKNPKIALTGIINFRNVAFGFDKYLNKVFRKMTLVNEPLPTFGFLSERQKSIEQKYSSLILFEPDVVINSGEANNEWTNILYASGYELATKVFQPPLLIPVLFRNESPQFEIFIKTSQNSINEDILIREYSSRIFEENLMSMANSIDIPQIDRQIKIVGKYFPDFKIPDINNYHIKMVIFDFLADAYEMAGRLQQSAKTRNFILSKTNDKDLFTRSSSFFIRHPGFGSADANFIE